MTHKKPPSSAKGHPSPSKSKLHVTTYSLIHSFNKFSCQVTVFLSNVLQEFIVKQTNKQKSISSPQIVPRSIEMRKLT